MRDRGDKKGMAKRRDMGIWRPLRDAIWGKGERRRGDEKRRRCEKCI